MTTLCIILFVSIAAIWFFHYEYPAVFGLYVPVRALRRLVFKILVALSLVSGLLVSGYGDVSISLSQYWGHVSIDCQSLIILIVSSLIILAVLRMFSVSGAAVYAFMGAIEAYRITSGQSGTGQQLLSILIAPVFAFVISAVLRYIFRRTLGRSNVHLITLSYYMRWAVIAGVILTSFAIGLNWGGFLTAGSSLINPSAPVMPICAVVIGLVMMIFAPVISDESDEIAGKFSTFSTFSVISVGFAVAIVLLFFSFDAVVGLLGLYPAPLAVSVLVMAAIAGTEVVNRRHLVESDQYAKETLAFIIAPLGSMLLSYVLLSVSGKNDEMLVDFTVMAAAILVLLAIGFTAYVRRQRTINEAKDRLVYSQQQQIYENSRALNDMELKVVLSENQALHNAVEMKRQEVMNVALSIVEQKEYLDSLNSIVKRLSKSKDDKEKEELIAELSASLKQRLSYEREVDSQYFYAQAESIHEDFNAKLSDNFPDLTQQERRLATLLRLGFSSKYIATLMSITPKSVEISRYRLRQKLGLSKGDNLVNFIKSI